MKQADLSIMSNSLVNLDAIDQQLIDDRNKLAELEEQIKRQLEKIEKLIAYISALCKE